jgi:type II secretory pathway pseudopilin PulG
MRVPRSRRGERAEGFTLVESIVTIGLIAAIVTLVIPTVVQTGAPDGLARARSGASAPRSATP